MQQQDWIDTKPIMSDTTHPKNSTCILWLAYYWDGGSVLYGRPCRRESEHKWQETEIGIWRSAQGLLTTVQQQGGGNRSCQIHQSSSLDHPTPPVAIWSLPTVPTNAQKFNFAGSRQQEGIFPVPQSSRVPRAGKANTWPSSPTSLQHSPLKWYKGGSVPFVVDFRRRNCVPFGYQSFH